ncbi:TPA: hypothetical protein ACX6RK_003226 [Photobacterium damselae]
MNDMSLIDIQEKIFAMSAMKSSNELPSNITLMASPNEQSIRDIQDLHEKNLIKWDFGIKSSAWGTPVSNPGHIIKCIAYYGDAVLGYYCVGYAIGCINEEKQCIEIDYIEKRCDASVDLNSKFLPIIVDAFTLYGLYLKHKGVVDINKFALINPLENVRSYYLTQGFSFDENYSSGCNAMIKYIINN